MEVSGPGGKGSLPARDSGNSFLGLLQSRTAVFFHILLPNDSHGSALPGSKQASLCALAPCRAPGGGQGVTEEMRVCSMV